MSSSFSLDRATGGRQPLRRRLSVLSAFAAVGALAFLPFLSAGSGEPINRLPGFVVAVTIVATLFAWPGLRCADAVGLPMPWLRALDGGPSPTVDRVAVRNTLLLGVVLGAIGVGALRLAKAPPLPGGASARALSVLFAAGPLEMVLHLGVMSIVVWLARGRRWVGIVAAGVALVGFHLTDGATTASGAVLTATIAGNGVIGLALGWIYAEYGLELAMLGHAVAHLITVLAGS